MGKFNLGELLDKQNQNMPYVRDIEAITGDILEAKRTGGEAILTIGRCLIEAKDMLSHGDWTAWLEERVEFSERSAQRFMRLAREWSNPTALSDLGATKALTLLALPPEEREQFLTEPHEVDGETKSVIDMSARQLEQAIRERKEAMDKLTEAEAVTEDLRDDLEREKSRVHEARQAADAAAKESERLRAELEAAKTAAHEVARLTRELEELKAKPVDVAVMQVDQEAIDKARAEAVAEMQDKLDKAKEAKKKAEEKRQEAEAALEAAKNRLLEAEKAAKAAAISGDKEMATFEVYFLEAQELANKLRGILLKLRGRDNQEAAGKVQNALRALGDAIGRAAE